MFSTSRFRAKDSEFLEKLAIVRMLRIVLLFIIFQDLRHQNSSMFGRIVGSVLHSTGHFMSTSAKRCMY
jgi:hypothetical protein